MLVTSCGRAFNAYLLVIACGFCQAQGRLRRLGPAPAPAAYITPGQDVWATTKSPEIPPLRPPPGPEVFGGQALKPGWEVLQPDAGVRGQEVELYDFSEAALNGQSAVLVKRVEITDQWIIRMHSGYTRAVRSKNLIVPQIGEPKAAETTLRPGTSGDDLSDPLNAAIPDVLFPAPEKPRPVKPTLKYNVVPGSPEADTGVPLTDPVNDVTAGALGSVHDFWNDASDTHDWMSQYDAAKAYGKVDVLGTSCQDVCMKCTLAALGQPWGNMCPCYTTCQRGTDDGICKYQDRSGWTDQQVSRPHERWRSQCAASNGRWQACASCLPLKFQAAVQRCKTQPDVAGCASEVRKLIVPGSTGPLADLDPLRPSANFVGANYFCFKPILKMGSCEGFAVLPANGQGSFALDPEANEWRCYSSARECVQRLREGDRPWAFDKQVAVVWDAVGPYSVTR